jgi:hypothetical protein
MERLNRFLGVFILSSLASLPGGVEAAEYSGRITRITLADASHVVYLHIEGGTPQKPACSNGTLSFSMNRQHAREYLAALMLAYAMAHRIDFATQGSCSDVGDSDTITHFRVNND